MASTTIDPQTSSPMEHIASTDDLKRLADQLANDKEIKIHDLVLHFHPTDLPLTTDAKSIHDNQHSLTQILLHLASSTIFRSLSLLSQSATSPIHDKTDRFNWKLQNLSPDLVALLNLQQYAGPGGRIGQTPPALRVSGFSEVPAHVMTAWISNARSLSLENVSLDFATVIDLQKAMAEGGGSRPSVAPAQSSLRHLSLKLKPLELAQFVYFHRQVLGETSPMYGVESLELWTSGVLRNEEMFLQFFGNGRRMSGAEKLSLGMQPEFKNLVHLTLYKIYDKAIHGENPANGPLTLSNFNLSLVAPALRTHRKVIRAVLQESSLHIFQRSSGSRPLGLKYHAAQFVERFRDALQRPGPRVERFEREWRRRR